MDTRVLVFLLLAVVTVSRCRAEMGILEASLKAGYQAFTQCQNEDDSLTCLKLRALRFVDRANLVSRIPMTDGLSLVRVESDERSMDEDNEIIPEVDRQLPTDLEQRSEYLDELLSKRINRFFKLHQLEFGFPKNVYEEGRQKNRKRLGPLLIAGALMKAGMMAITYQAVAMLAGKALLVAKVALVLASVIGLKKLASHGGGGGGEKVTYEIVKDSGHGGGDSGGHYRRFIVEQGRTINNGNIENEQQMAFRGYPAPSLKQ